MKHFAYILQSEKTGRFYKGQSDDVITRLKQHNSGKVASTRNKGPWKIIWVNEKESRIDAMALERKLKNLSRKRLIDLMNKYPSIKIESLKDASAKS